MQTVQTLQASIGSRPSSRISYGISSPARVTGPRPTPGPGPKRSRSTERILTTHVGSLPRGPAVLELLYKKENGEPYDAAAFDAAVAAAVDDVVAKQVAVGIDIVSDGETSKVGYATYIKDRLSGF